MLPTKIMVPVDLSEFSKVALDTAAQLARLCGAKMLVLHVMEGKLTQCIDDYCLSDALVKSLGGSPAAQASSDIAMEGPAQELEQQFAAGAKQALDSLVEKVRESGGVVVETRIEKGVPYEIIVRTAAAQGIDLIVMPSHGKSGLKEFYLGSTAEKVVRHAGCSVFVVRV